MARPALAATRAIAVLDFLAARATEEFSLSGLAAELDINLASTHALLTALAETGYVVRHPRLRTYSLGPALVALGGAALQRHPAIDEAQQEARSLSAELGLAVAVTAVAGDDIVFLSRAGAHGPHDLAVQVGDRIPLVPPTGPVFAAWHDTERWLERSSDRATMERLLATVRDQGWAAGVRTGDSEHEAMGVLDRRRRYDLSMIAAPVFDANGEAVVALTLLGFTPGLPASQVSSFGERVRQAGLVVTRRSGGRAPAAVPSPA